MRWILRGVFLGLSALLALWAGEGLFLVDRHDSLIPLSTHPVGGTLVMILAGILWGFLLMTPGADVLGVGRHGGLSALAALRTGGAGTSRPTEVAVATIRETSPTGMSLNDVPVHETILDVAPAEGPSFLGSVRHLVGPLDAPALVPGAVLPVRFDPARRDTIAVADLADPGVTEAILRWRVAKGLIHPDLVDARLHGTRVPASVLAVRPTGRRAHGQVELEVDLLIPASEGRPSREAGTLVFVDPRALSSVQVGSPVTALYRPGRPELVAMTLDGDPEGAS